MKNVIKLGATYKDKVTGFKGVAMALTEYLSGCDRVSLQPPMDKDGKIPEWQNFDVTQVTAVGKKVIELVKPEPKSKVKPGGPRPSPQRR
jgi:hypothetical protein